MDNKFNCIKCTGIESCNKYCNLKVGVNIVNFINGVDVVETSIGELREDHRTKEKSLIVCGHGIETYPSPIYMLAGLNSVIDVSGKFRDYGGETPIQIIRAYMNHISMSKEGIKNSIETFKKFNSNRLLPTPIKPGVECEVALDDGKYVKCWVQGVYWSTNRETKKLECKITCELEKGVLETKGKMVQVMIVDYGTKIRLPFLERTLKSSEIDRDLIKMAPVGFIKPIVIEDKQYKLALDSSFMYQINNDMAYIIGVWKDGEIIEFAKGMEAVRKSKAFRKLMNGAKYVDKHRRFIVPYGLFDENYIKLR